MEKEFVEKIISANKIVFGNINEIIKINAGFTNTLYSIDNKYIIKICNNKDNENRFENEINFYKYNSDNKYIPKLFASHVSKSKTDYSYEILEKINGKSLYYVWNKFDESKRKEIVKEIVKIMKSFHSIKGNSYDWGLFINNKLKTNFDKCSNLNIFSKEQIKLANNILSKINLYLKSNDFRMIHSDIHFDNILICENDQLKIIDFETSLFAPLDYELDIFLRMCNNPLKYASEEVEGQVKIEDYNNIENYLRIYYPELFDFDNYELRHEIYNLEANLRLLARFANDKELKKVVIGILNKIFELMKKEYNL